MVIVTTATDLERAGCLVGFHSQCSIEPPRYSVWISKANHTYRVVLFADHVAVHFLGREHRELAELFGTESSDDIDKFARCNWEPGTEGVPLLADCPTRLIGRRHTVLDDGSDHVCVVIDPVRATGAPATPPLRLSEVSSLDPGHDADERPHS